MTITLKEWVGTQTKARLRLGDIARDLTTDDRIKDWTIEGLRWHLECHNACYEAKEALEALIKKYKRWLKTQ